MSSVTVYYCDRCDKDTCVSELVRVGDTHTRNSVFYYKSKLREVELCPSCLEALKLWMEKE